MDTQQLEQELQLFDRLMYMAVGASIILMAVTYRHLDYENIWPGFQHHAGVVWQLLQIAVTPPAFYLLLSKRWKGMPWREKKNTIVGFLIASWFTFLSLGFITLNFYIAEIGTVITVGAALIALGYAWIRRQKPNQAEEIFP